MSKDINSPFISKEKILIKDIKQLIEESRSTVAKTINSILTLLYWRIGKRITEDELKDSENEIID